MNGIDPGMPNLFPILHHQMCGRTGLTRPVTYCSKPTVLTKKISRVFSLGRAFVDSAAFPLDDDTLDIVDNQKLRFEVSSQKIVLAGFARPLTL